MTGRAAAATILLGAAAVFVHTCRRLLLQVTITAHRRRHLVCYIFTTTAVIPVARSRYPELLNTTDRLVEAVHTCMYLRPAKPYADFDFFYNISEVPAKARFIFYMG